MGKQLLDTCTASLICGIVSIVFALADAAILAGPHLPELFSVAVSIALISAAVLALVVGTLSGMQFCIAGAQEVTIVVLATMVISISASLGEAGLSGQEQLSTVIATLLLATIVVGAACILAGYFKLGRFIRYMPYPVIAGFLAGASLLLIKYSVEMAIGDSLTLSSLSSYFGISSLSKLFLATVICVSLFLLSPRYSSGSVIIALIVLFLPGFYLMVYFSGDPMHSWIQADWTLVKSIQASSVPVLSIEDFKSVDWGLVFGHLPQMGSLALITLITALIKISTLESIAKVDVDQNRELKAIGVGNVVAGFSGGILGFHTLSITEIARRMEAPTRLAGIGVFIVCMAALFFSGDVLAYLPRFLFAGIILWISVDLLISFCVKPLRQLPLFDSSILVSVLLAIVLWGFLPAVLLGLVAATLIFVIEYSKVNIIRSEYSGDKLRSNVDRTLVAANYLQTLGEELKVFRLQGYMFFGTAYRLVEDIKIVLHSKSVRFLLLDFQKISGVDVSANITLSRLLSHCHNNDIVLMLSDAPASIVNSFNQEAGSLNMVDQDSGGVTGLLYFPDLDAALEHYETVQLKSAAGEIRINESVELDSWLQSAATDTQYVELSRYFTERQLEVGEVLIEEGSIGDKLHVVLSGSLNIMAEIERRKNIRVRKVGPGSMLGEISLYTGDRPTANVIAAENSRIASIDKNDIDRLLEECPQIAAVFHRKIATELALRLADNRRLIELHATA